MQLPNLYILVKHTFFLLCFFSAHLLNAQNTDTTTLFIKEVLIVDTKETVIKNTKKVVIIDSAILSMHSTSNLSELLSNQSSIHIKAYGNGNIATSSMRGGNANHTAILWNGLSIQNPMLGQTDLSLIQASMFDNVLLEFGGNSAAWGSGAIGGSIQLQNKSKFNEGLKTKTQLSYGSFDTRKLITSAIYSKAKFYSNTRLYFNESKNNYIYIDTLNKENNKQVVNHADFSNKGLMQEISFLLNPKNTLNLRFWYNSTNRKLPSFTQTVSKKNQVDESIRFNADWEIKKRKLNSTIRTAYFNDVLNYADSIANIFSESKVHTFIGESDNNYKLKFGTLHFGINYTLYKTDTKNYDSIHQLSKTAFFAGYNIALLKSKLIYTVFLRKEITNQTLIPFTGNTGLAYKLTKKVMLKVNASKSYRQPSLNDLYWKQGGNINLLPEDSREIEGALEFKHHAEKIDINFIANYFNRETKNWIVWLPSDKGYWTPRNILEVYSRGSETKTTLSYTENKLLFKLDLNTSYVLSTSQKNVNENDNSKNRQLIYTPRYTGYMSFIIQYKNTSLLYNYNYTGYRFTSTDNTSWLMPYQTSNIKVSTKYDFKKMTFVIFGSVNNIYNKNYLVVANNPMPLRNFELGISLNYNKNK